MPLCVVVAFCETTTLASSNKNVKRKSVRMKRKTKRLLGVFGLAMVVAMTAVAYALPTPEARAEDTISDSEAVTIQVKVVGPGSTANLVKPANGEVVRSNIVPVEYTFQRMKTVLTNLSCTGANGAKVEQVVDTYNVSEEDGTGTRKFNMNLNTWGVQADATCRVFLTGKSTDDKDIRDEGAAFEYRAINVDMGDSDDENNKPITDEKGDPEVTIGISDEVYSLLLQVYDESGKPVFVKGDVEEPILVSRDMFDLKNGNYKLNLPMSKYGAKSGWYELVAIAYGQDGKEVISMNVYRFYYDAKTPNVPGTGTVMENLNISRADYVVTGLIAFGAVAMFGVYLVARKSRR